MDAGLVGLLRLSNLPPFLVVDREGSLQFCNEPANVFSSRYFQKNPVTGQTIFALFNEKQALELKACLAKALAGETSRLQIKREVNSYEIACEPYLENGVCLTLQPVERDSGSNPAETKPVSNGFQSPTEETLYRILKNLPITLLVTDREGIITLVQNPLSVGLNYNLDNAIGHSIHEKLQNYPDRLEGWLHALKGENFPAIITEHNGSVFETHFAPLLNQRNEPDGALSISLNITAQYKAQLALERNENLYRNLFEKAPIGIVKIDAQATLLEANDMFHQMLGYDPRTESLVDKPVIELTYEDDRETNRQVFLELQLGQRVHWQNRKRFLKKDGSSIWAQLAISTIRDEQHNLLYYIGLIQDINERYQAELALRKSEELYRSLVENFPSSIFIFDHELRYIAVDGKSLEEIGLEKDFMVGKTIFEVLPPEVSADLEPIYRRVLHGEEITEQELVYGPYHYSLVVVPLQNVEGDTYAGLAVANNITPRKQTEQALRDSELKLRTSIDSMIESFFLVGRDHLLQLFNKRAKEVVQQVWGLQLAENQYFPDILPDKARVGFFDHFTQALQGQYQDVEVLMEVHNGQEDWAEIRYNPVVDETGQINSVCLTLLNISARKRIDQALRNSEARLRAVLDNLQQTFYLIDRNYRVRLFNRRAADSVRNALGLILNENQDFRYFIEPDNLPLFYESFDRAWHGEYLNQEIILKSSSGEELWSETRYNPVIEDNGSISGVCISMLNITDRKRAEEALKVSESLLRTTLDNLQQSFYLIDLDDRLLLYNQIAARFSRKYLGIELKTGIDIFEIALPNYQAEFRENLEKARNGIYSIVEKEIVVDSGQSFWTEFRFNPVKDEAGKLSGICITMVNIADRKQAEKALQNSETLLRTLMDNIQQSFYLLDHHGTLLLFNKVAAEFFREIYKHDLVSGRPFLEQIPVGYIEHYLSVFEKIRAGEYIKLELFLRDNAPQLTWAEAVCNPIFDKDGAISGMCFTTTDITERKQAEQALQLSEMHLRILLDNIPQTFFLVDNKGILLLFNKKAEEAFRDIFNTNLVTGRTLEEQLPLEYNGFFKEAISATLKDQNYKVEVLLPLNTINILWAEVICNPIYGADGTVQYVCFTSTDITERKQAEQALQSSEYRLRTLMDNIQQTFFLLDKNGTLLLNNKVVTRAFRLVFRTRLFTGRTLLEQLPVKYQEQFSTAFAAILTGQSFTTELLVPGPHGKKLWAEVVGNPIFAANGTVSSICFTSSNITERKQAEQALRESEERFSKMLAAAPIPIALAYKGVYTEVNEAFEKFTGYSRAETLGNYAPKFLKFTPEDSATLEWLLRQHGAVKEFETRVITRSGEERDIILSIEKIEISGLVYTLAISYDITERKKAEQALRTSEARLRSLMDNTQQYFFLLDTDLRIQFVNKQVGEYYHKVRNLNYVPDKPFSNYFLPQYLEENLELLYRARNGEVINTELYRTEQDGTRRIWHGWASPVREEDGNISGVCVTLIDITERKQAEQELKEALVEKEVLLKEVHHRVKNNLQIISSLLKLQGTVTQEPEALTILKDSQQRIRSIALIHEKLYQSDNLSQVNFGEYLRSLANQLLRSYQTVELELEMENLDSLWLGLDQAIPCGLIVNELLTNSLKYAFPPDYKKQAKITIDMQLNQKENYIRLTISDNGIGLPEGLDPANTETLGYQLVEMLTRQLDGHLIIGSKPDTGTRIEIGFRI